jgi:hypothetical protein
MGFQPDACTAACRRSDRRVTTTLSISDASLPVMAGAVGRWSGEVVNASLICLTGGSCRLVRSRLLPCLESGIRRYGASGDDIINRTRVDREVAHAHRRRARSRTGTTRVEVEAARTKSKAGRGAPHQPDKDPLASPQEYQETVIPELAQGRRLELQRDCLLLSFFFMSSDNARTTNNLLSHRDPRGPCRSTT